MKKIASLFSVLTLSVALAACGTAGVNNLDNPRALDMNTGYDRNVYDVNYNDVDDVYDGGRNRTIYTDRSGNVTNFSRINGYGNPATTDDPIHYQRLDDRDVDQRTRTLTR